MTEFGLSELYEVVIKATYPIEVNGKTFEPGETLAAFDRIQIANFQEIKKSVSAHGGWDDRGFVFWDSTKEVRVEFAQGIFSKTQLALLTAARLVEESQSQLPIVKRESLESNENGVITLSQPCVDPIYVYNAGTYDKLSFTKLTSKTLQISTPFTEVVVDYRYIYTNSTHTLIVGQPLTTGFLVLEGKTRVKDDITGQTHTGILQIPRLKLLSDLSMRLGKNATPVVGHLSATALPKGERRDTSVMNLVLLDDDIDSDM